MKNTMMMAVVAAALLVAAPAVAQEHPAGMEHPKAGGEHPKAGKEHPKAGKEHPKEHPAAKPAKHPAGSEKWLKQIRKEYDDFVCEHTARPKGEGFMIADEKLGKTWELKMLKVHKKNIVQLGGNRFFACADLKTLDGKDKLDLDFYATKLPDGSWRMDKVVLHKVNGQPRYTYNEKNEMVPLKQ